MALLELTMTSTPWMDDAFEFALGNGGLGRFSDFRSHRDFSMFL
jgi:hypothetical protein